MIKYTQEQIEELDKFYKHPRNLLDLFEDTVTKWGDRNAIGTKNPQTKQYEWITYKRLAERINNVRSGIHQLGIHKGDAVGVIIGNSVEWYVLENASHGLGAVFVPMYEKELMKTWQYIVRDSGVKYLFVKDAKIAEQVKHFKTEIETLKDVFTIYGGGEKSLQVLEEGGKKNPVPSYKPHWKEPAELIYTSGTTGEPKGVLLSHGNLSACSQSGYHIFPSLNEKSVSLAILPWAHSYGLSAELHNFMQFGGAIALMESVDTLAEDLLKVKPTFLIAVPKVFNKVYDGIQAKMHEEGGLKKKLFDMSCEEAVKCRSKATKSLRLKILDKIVFSKIREKFGGRLEGVLTASAVMNPQIAMFFADLGIPTYDAYGLTETSPAITMNSPLLGNRYGSVGKCVENMHVRIDKSLTGEESEDGEIIAYGAHVMMGYHNKPKLTSEFMMKDRWNGFPGIRTGDQGRLSADGFLYITGRFKDEYKLSNGKYIHPESLETDIKLIRHIANAFVWGEGKEYNIAVIVPDFESMKKDERISTWAQGSPQEVVKNKNIQDFLSVEIKKHLQKSYGGYEIPQKFIFASEDFTLENGLVTQTMKLKRNMALKTYSKEIAGLAPQVHDLCLGVVAVQAQGARAARTAMRARTLNEASAYGSDFARGMRMVEANKVALHISGTASIDEAGRTAHPGDFERQVDRMLGNVAALLDGQGASFEDVVSAITYLKRPSDAKRLREKLHEAGYEGFPNALVVAPVCRPELLCETEALAVLPRGA